MQGSSELERARAADHETIDLLTRFVAVASISARGELLQEGAAHAAGLLADSGLDATVWRDEGAAPVVFGHRPAPAGAPTLLFYGHYDVQPPDPLEEWRTPPFEATLRDGAVYGRGAGDNKGQLLAHIMATRLLARSDELGVGVKFLIEGEEEIGSPSLAAVAHRHRAELGADLAITSDAPLNDADEPLIIFGVRGLLYVEIAIDGAVRDLHSGSRGGIAPSPAWELVHLLASLRGADGAIRVAGFRDGVRAPDRAEEKLLDALEDPRASWLADMGVDALPPATADAPWRQLMFEPTLNIAGLTSGYGGAGVKTIVPAQARCKIDVRLVADQDPDEVFAALTAHVARFNPRARVRRLAAVPPSATPVDTPYAAAVETAIERALGRPPRQVPRMGGTTPDFVFTRVLGIPSLLIPYGPPGMNHHAPNERMTLTALQRGIACSLALCSRYGPLTAATHNGAKVGGT